MIEIYFQPINVQIVILIFAYTIHIIFYNIYLYSTYLICLCLYSNNPNPTFFAITSFRYAESATREINKKRNVQKFKSGLKKKEVAHALPTTRPNLYRLFTYSILISYKIWHWKSRALCTQQPAFNFLRGPKSTWRLSESPTRRIRNKRVTLLLLWECEK